MSTQRVHDRPRIKHFGMERFIPSQMVVPWMNEGSESGATKDGESATRLPPGSQHVRHARVHFQGRQLREEAVLQRAPDEQPRGVTPPTVASRPRWARTKRGLGVSSRRERSACSTHQRRQEGVEQQGAAGAEARLARDARQQLDGDVGARLRGSVGFETFKIYIRALMNAATAAALGLEPQLFKKRFFNDADPRAAAQNWSVSAPASNSSTSSLWRIIWLTAPADTSRVSSGTQTRVHPQPSRPMACTRNSIAAFTTMRIAATVPSDA